MIGKLARDLEQVWGFQSLSMLDLEERISSAAEKAPTDDPQIVALRHIISLVKDEFDVVVNQRKHALGLLVDCMLSGPAS